MSASEPTAVPRPWPDLQTIVDPMIKAFMLQTNTPGAIVSVQINACDHHSLSGHPSGAPVAGYERGGDHEANRDGNAHMPKPFLACGTQLLDRDRIVFKSMAKRCTISPFNVVNIS